MVESNTPKVVAGICGLAAFAIAIIAGLGADNPADQIITRAMVSMLACYVVGWGVGSVADLAVREAVAKHKEQNPIPESVAQRPSDNVEAGAA